MIDRVFFAAELERVENRDSFEVVALAPFRAVAVEHVNVTTTAEEGDSIWGFGIHC